MQTSEFRDGLRPRLEVFGTKVTSGKAEMNSVREKNPISRPKIRTTAVNRKEVSQGQDPSPLHGWHACMHLTLSVDEVWMFDNSLVG